jgi:iron complex transport system permease protein
MNFDPSAGSDGFGKRLREAAAFQASVLTVVLVGLVVASTGMGYIQIPSATVVKIILGKLGGSPESLAGMNEIFPVIVMDVRLPRILTAALVGGGLAMCGVVFQGILLNPLADPYTLGVSAGAAFGAALAILMNMGTLGAYSVPLFAFLGAVATLAAVIYLSTGSSRASS